MVVYTNLYFKRIVHVNEISDHTHYIVKHAYIVVIIMFK